MNCEEEFAASLLVNLNNNNNNSYPIENDDNISETGKNQF